MASRYPSKTDPRFQHGLIIPDHAPKFKIKFEAGQKIFTIGSCFARNIESSLEALGVNIPTRSTKLGINEYNPGAILQRVKWALSNTIPNRGTIVQHLTNYYDLLLDGRNELQARNDKGVPTIDLALARRAEMFLLYKNLASADVVFFTLGFVEAWYDNETSCWLNRAPTFDMSNPRYELKKLDLATSIALLSECMELLSDKKVIISVSPVPIEYTFNSKDCVVANLYSKSTLRLCAEALCDKFSHVDYFPGYEIIQTAGFNAFEDDLRHIKPEVVTRVCKYFIDTYSSAI